MSGDARLLLGGAAQGRRSACSVQRAWLSSTQRGGSCGRMLCMGMPSDCSPPAAPCPLLTLLLTFSLLPFPSSPLPCSECDLALDVYQELLAEGCAPNLVTFNILIDIHGKAGQWARAVDVLDQAAAAGCAAEPRTYNTVISACSKAGQPGAARAVYARMLADGVQPTGTTYTSLISAFGKAGQVEEALRIYRVRLCRARGLSVAGCACVVVSSGRRGCAAPMPWRAPAPTHPATPAQDMAARGCECNVITFSSLIFACERAGRCDLALTLWEEMRREGCRPNVVTYNALLGACAHGEPSSRRRGGAGRGGWRRCPACPAQSLPHLICPAPPAPRCSRHVGQGRRGV